LSSLD